MEGSLLAYSGQTNSTQSLGSAAIASNIWAVYEKQGRLAFREDELQFIVLQCEEGNVAITQVSNLLLCLYAKETVSLGILMQKTKKVAEYLKTSLQSLFATS